MNRQIDRRDFLKAAGFSASLASSFPVLAQRKRNLKIGHTGITWVAPPAPRPATADGAPPAGRGSGGPRRIDPRDETYAVMEAVDTRNVKFGPDIGQLQKGGSDPVQVVKDFLPIVNHMHMKDYSGGESFVGYCPLGQGKVNIPAILDMMEGRTTAGMIMVELDGGPRMPITALETATIAKAYLEKQGVSFR